MGLEDNQIGEISEFQGPSQQHDQREEWKSKVWVLSDTHLWEGV